MLLGVANITFIFRDMVLGGGDKKNIINLGEMWQVVQFMRGSEDRGIHSAQELEMFCHC